MFTAFKKYLLSLKLSPVSRKLYLSDVRRFLHWLDEVESVTLDQVVSPKIYIRYLDSLRTQAMAPSMLKRTIASLKQFSSFLTLTYNIQNPMSNVSLAPKLTSSSITALALDYIKHFTNYLNSEHLSPSTIKSYKSDITRYLYWASTTLPSAQIEELLTDKNIKIYLNHLTQSGVALKSTIDRKSKSIARFKAWYLINYRNNVISDNINSANKPTKKFQILQQQMIVPSGTTEAKSSPDKSPILVKKTNSRISLAPYFASASVRNFTTILILIIFVASLGIFGYRQFSRDVSLTAAFPSTPVTPNRQLSFQGRLENAAGTPITVATNFTFKLYDAITSGTQLYTSGVCSITPDADGVFSTQIGSTCGSAIASSVFTENANVFLEVTVVSDILAPRQQIASVAYALNSETLQGFPISSTVSAIRNTVVPMNQWGEIIVGEQSPRLTGVSGTFAISAPSISITTATGTNGNITLAPDGTGQVNINGNTTSTNFFNVSNAQLTTGSLITGTSANNNTGFKLIDLLSGSSPTSKFSVSDAGTVTIAGNLVPAVTDTSNIGTSSSLEFNNIYAATLHQGANLVCDASGANCPVGATYWTRTAGNLSPSNLNDTISATTSASTAMTITQTGAFNALLVEDQASDPTPFVIDQSGNVGVGTTTPGYKLDVAGTASIDSLNINGAYTLPTTDGTSGYVLQTNGSGTVTWQAQTGGGVTADSLDFTDFKDLMTLDASTDIALGALTLSTSGTGAVSLNNSGAFTVASTAWTATPTISGLITATSGLTANGDLTSNANTILGNGATDTTNITGITNFAGGTTYFVSAIGDAKFNDLVVSDSGNPGLTVGDSTGAYILIGGSTISDANTGANLTLDSDSNSLTIAATDTTLTATGIATLDLAATVAWDVATLNVSSLTAINTGALVLNTTDWDISATGAMTGIGAITADGLFTGTAGMTITGAAINLNASSNFGVNIATGTSTGAIAIGGGTATQTVAINSADWDISTTGAMTGIGAITADGLLTLSGTAANIALGSNYLSGDGGDEGISVDSTGNVTMTGTTGLTLSGTGGQITFAYGENINNDTDGLIETSNNLRVLGGTIYGSIDDSVTYLLSTNTIILDLDNDNDSGSQFLIRDGLDATLFQLSETGIADIAATLEITVEGNSAGVDALCGSIALNGDVAADVANERILDCSGAPTADYAEIYPTKNGIEFAEIVTTSDEIVQTKKYEDRTLIEGQSVTMSKLQLSTTPYQSTIIGITSNNYGDFTSTGHGVVSETDHPLPVALSGRVPVKISPASTAIKVGDPITSSNDPGRGMKAIQAGRIVGTSLENWSPDNPTDKILVFVNNTYFDPTLVLNAHGNLPLLATAELKTNLLSPLAPDQPITITAPVVITSSSNSETPPLGSSGAELVVEGEIQSNIISARVAILSDIQANNITARNIVADTISANHIEGLDAKLATFSAELTDSELTSITDRIKDRLASLIGTPSATAADLPIPQEATASPTPSEVDGVVGQTNISLLDADFVTINQYLAVIGTATITTLDVTNGLYTNTISSKDNLLAIQPLGGIINLANNTLIVDSAGQVAINGDLTVSGKLLAESASINSLELGTPSATSSALGKLLAIYNEQGIAVATIDASGSADFKNISTQLITIANAPSASNSGLLTSFAQSNATAGNSVLLAPNTELTIHSPFVTTNSLVYLTPTTNTDNKVLFVKSKSEGNFTVGIDTPATSDISFNWWIIQLTPN